MNFNERIGKLNKKIAEADKIVFFTGAGISTESGIKDFRSAAGMVAMVPWENLVIINKSETPYDHYAELVFHQSLGDVFTEVRTNG